MNYIKFDGSTLNRLQDIFEKNNNNILYSLKKIDTELSEIKLVLDTPKSNRGMTKIVEIMKENNEMVSKNGEKMSNRLNKIRNAYDEYFSETIKTIGDDYE